MKTEKRIYLINFYDYKDGNCSTADFQNLSDNEWIEISEIQGSVYSLLEFCLRWDVDALPYETTFIRILDVEI